MTILGQPLKGVYFFNIDIKFFLLSNSLFSTILNQTFLNKVDVEQITFDKAKKCNEILNNFKLELEKNKDFNIEEVDDISF